METYDFPWSECSARQMKLPTFHNVRRNIVRKVCSKKCLPMCRVYSREHCASCSGENVSTARNKKFIRLIIERIRSRWRVLRSRGFYLANGKETGKEEVFTGSRQKIFLGYPSVLKRYRTSRAGWKGIAETRSSPCWIPRANWILADRSLEKRGTSSRSQGDSVPCNPIFLPWTKITRNGTVRRNLQR